MTLSHEHPAAVAVSPLLLPPTRRTHCPCVGFFGGEHDDAASAHAAGLAHDATAYHQDWLERERLHRRR